MKKLILIGRPNVGKSTLFNKLTRKETALTSSISGTTRDFKNLEFKIEDETFLLTDTAGFEFFNKDQLLQKQNNILLNELKNSHIILLILDATIGITSEDLIISKQCLKYNKNIILLFNKSDKKGGFEIYQEGWSLGVGRPIPISAAHGNGINDLLYEIKNISISNYEKTELEENENKSEKIKFAIIGQPNTGKSTLVNHLLGFERMLTGSKKGITHDSVENTFNYKGIDFCIVDTAGIRRKTKINEYLEKIIVKDSFKAINFSHIAVLLVDSNYELSKQDLSLARKVVDEGRGLIIAINKWDIVNQKQNKFKIISERINRSFPDLKKLPLLKLSGLNGLGLDKLIKEIQNIYQKWNKRIPTAKLNYWIENIKINKPAPIVKGRKTKLLYISQIKIRPPKFVLFINHKNELPKSYSKFLINKIRDNFDFIGVPIRLDIKSNKNPYVK